MMTMCPSCFELYSEIWSKPCCDCGYKTVSISIELIGLAKLLINRGFKVAYANGSTYDDKLGIGKITQFTIELGASYPEAIFQNLPPDWTVYEFNAIKDNQILKPNLTGLSCVCEHSPSECDFDSIAFAKEVTINNLELWLSWIDELASRAILMLYNSD